MLEKLINLISSEDCITYRWYINTYSSIISRGKTRGFDKTKLSGYFESHHILPRCLGGSNESENLVLLTYREHVIVHLILVKLFPNNKDLIRASAFMLNVDRIDPITGKVITISLKNSKIAEEIKLKAVELNQGENSPSYGRKLTEEHKHILSVVNSHPKSEETIERMRKAQLGKKATDETKEKLSISHTGLKIHTQERKDYLSERWKKNNPRAGVDMTGENNPSSQKVKGPDGTIYKSIKFCASQVGVSYNTMRDWVKNKPEKGYILIQ